MVVRDEGDSLKRYCHIGTGNYHSKTARLYEDLGLLTCDQGVGEDVANLFNRLSGYSMNTEYSRLLVAPHSVRSGLVERIEREVEHHLDDHEARIRFKCNSIVDEKVIDALYRASQAGVPVDLLVRGICALRPGVAGLSDNIRVRSILGQFLEHSRIYEFANAGDPEIFIGSADMMHRNLDRRIETLVSITNEAHIAEITHLLDLGFDPQTASWHLDEDGGWHSVSTASNGAPLRDLQHHLITLRQRPLRSSR
jgi:polyphosphate kinase